jgi:hypothetical protein
MPTYKTKDGLDYILPSIGQTVDGLITTDQVIENPLFEEVAEAVQPVQTPVVAPVVAPTPPPAPVVAPPVAPVVEPTNQEGIK